MQTSLATKPKPRASAYLHGLTNLSTSQSTYANHQVIIMPYANGELQSGAQAHYYLPSALSYVKWPIGASIYCPQDETSRCRLNSSFYVSTDATMLALDMASALPHLLAVLLSDPIVGAQLLRPVLTQVTTGAFHQSPTCFHLL